MKTPTGRFIGILLIFFVLIGFVTDVTVAAQSVSKDEPIPVNKPNANVDNVDELNQFFRKFLTLGDYDIEDMTKSNEVALKFAVEYAIHVDGASQQFIDSGNIIYAEGYGVDSSITDYDGRVWDYVEYTSVNNVDAFLLKFFNINDFQHKYIIGDFVYKNQRYYYLPPFDAGYMHKATVIHNYDMHKTNVIEYHDNKNGTFSVRIEATEYNYDGELQEKYYDIAVIQPYKDNGNDTYQLLFWKNRVSKDAPLPVRQLSTNSIDKAKINSFTSKNNQAKFNLDEIIYLTVKTNSAVTNVRYEYRDNGVWKYDELYATIPNSSTQTEKTWTTNFALTKETIDAVRVIASNEHSEDSKVIDIIMVLDEENPYSPNLMTESVVDNAQSVVKTTSDANYQWYIQQAIERYSSQWWAANARGDTAGMGTAHAKANLAREVGKN